MKNSLSWLLCSWFFVITITPSLHYGHDHKTDTVGLTFHDQDCQGHDQSSHVIDCNYCKTRNHGKGIIFEKNTSPTISFDEPYFIQKYHSLRSDQIKKLSSRGPPSILL